MIVPPKKYGTNLNGGYLLNDDEEFIPLIIDKANYDHKSVIEDHSVIYEMVNRLSSVPYKINTVLLDFLLEKGREFGILMDDSSIKEYEDTMTTKKLSNLNMNKYKALKSKQVVENYVLQLAEVYRNNTIYFPLRLDQRGRVYAVPFYLTYQGTDLSKALLQFSTPGIINKLHNPEKLKYFFIYGANMFGLDKQSNVKRIRWVKDNVDNILNYRNGVLIKEAKNKPLFLAFCIEYVRFNEFVVGENIAKWETYLPIQLDATCNGFQHLSMLSYEAKMYDTLNLASATDEDDPKDFYAFISAKISLKLEMSINLIYSVINE